MKAFGFLSLFTVLLLVGCNKNPTTPTAATNTAAGGNPLNAPNEYLGAMDKGRRRAISTVDIAQINQAIQVFNTDHDRFPKDLNELVAEKLLVKVPDAPYGMKIDYDPATGTVKVVPDDSAK